MSLRCEGVLGQKQQISVDSVSLQDWFGLYAFGGDQSHKSSIGHFKSGTQKTRAAFLKLNPVNSNITGAVGEIFI